MLDNRIALTAVIGEVLGIILGLYCKISIVPIFLLIFLIYLILKKEDKKEKFKLISFKRYFRYVKIVFNKKVIKIIIIFSCISNSIVLYQNYRCENLYKNVNEKDIEITGIVESQSDKKIKIKVDKGKYKNTFLYVYLKNDIKLEYGNEIKISGKFYSPQKRTNYKGFDYSNYLKTLKIYGTINANNVNIVSKDKGNVIFKYANKLTTKFKLKIEKSNLSKDEKSLIEGILLGDKENISENIVNDFSESNISHILAISGLHISYIIIFSNFLFSKTIGKHYSKVFTSIIIIIYMFITSFPPSLVRAGITGIIGIMSSFVYRRNDIWESLGIALLCILTYNPFLISDVGLLLSFAGTIGIITFSNVLNKKINYNIEIINNTITRKNKRFLKFFIKLTNTKIFKIVQNATIVTISATLMVSPIVLIYFNKLSITSLLVSIITSFIIAPIIIVGIIFIILDINIISKILSFLLKILIYIAKWGSILPLNQIILVTPSILEICIYYILIFSTFFILKINIEKNKSAFQIRIKNLLSLFKYKFKINKKKFISKILIISFIYLVFLGIPKNLKIYFVDVGQGDCTLIRTPLNKTILIDGGGSDKKDYDVRERCINAIFIR